MGEYLQKNHPNYWRPTILKIYEAIRALKKFRILGMQAGKPALENSFFLRCPTSLFIESEKR